MSRPRSGVPIDLLLILAATPLIRYRAARSDTCVAGCDASLDVGGAGIRGLLIDRKAENGEGHGD
jgi:hypothetical protein